MVNMTLFFLTIIVFLASFFAAFCVGSGGKPSTCSNREHSSPSWANTEKVGKISHPKPKKEVLDYFQNQGLTKQTKKAKSAYPRYCEVCVQVAIKKLANQTKQVRMPFYFQDNSLETNIRPTRTR